MHKKKPEKLEIISYVFLALAVVLSVANFFLIASQTGNIGAAGLAKQQDAPARLELVILSVSSCPDCFDVNPVIETLKKSNVAVTSEKTVEYSSPEAKQLIGQYAIKKLPTVIVLGEVNKPSVANLWSSNWQVELKDGAPVSAVYSGVSPPFLDEAGNVKGLVSLTQILDESCPKCSDFAQATGFFKQNGAKFSSEKTIDYASPEAKELIARFGVQRVPALIISRDILDYPGIAAVWSQLNATEKQGFFALHALAPPYRDLAANKIEGLVSVIYLKDETCTSCYDVQVNRQILEKNFKLALAEETTVDVSSDSGKALLKKYGITKVPIMLASSDASAYASFVQVWPQVGDIADDGWFIMRNPEIVGAYKDLNRGIVVNQVTVLGGEFKFQPDSIQVKKGETVRIVFINAGTVEHDLTIDELEVKTGLVQPGKSEIVEFVADQNGTFSFYCSVEDHRGQGMEGKITVN